MIRPADMDECFRLLDSATVDGVIATEMQGLSTAASVGLRDRVRGINEPLGLDTLHVVVSKTHPFARTMLYYVNAGLKRVRETGEFERIVERHLQRFWTAQEAIPNATIADAPATRQGAGARNTAGTSSAAGETGSGAASPSSRDGDAASPDGRTAN